MAPVMDRFRAETAFRPWDLAITVGWAVLVRIALVGPVRPAIYWDSASYLQEMHKLTRSPWLLYPGMRPPGYPLFLLATSWNGRWLSGTVLAQQLLGVTAVCLVYLILIGLGEPRAVALTGALVYSVMPNVLFMEVTIYSETLALSLLTLAAFLLVVHMRMGPGKTRLCAALGMAAAGGALARPILQIAVAVFGAGLLGWWLLQCRRSHPPVHGWAVRARKSFRCFAGYLLTAGVVLGAVIGINGLRSGHFRLASGAGFSSLNYLGYPAMHRDLPPRLAWISGIYRRLDGKQPAWQPYVLWRFALPPILEERARLGLPSGNWDRAALHTTWEVVRVRPLVYLKLWKETFLRYWTDFRVLFGPWTSHRDAGKWDRLQVSPFRWRLVGRLDRLWSHFQPLVSLLFFLSLPLILLDPKRDPATRWTILCLWVLVVALAVVSTALEPALGQARYRMPSSPLIVALATLTVSSAIRLVIGQRAADRERGVREGTGRAV